jgi:hypothetical protein
MPWGALFKMNEILEKIAEICEKKGKTELSKAEIKAAVIYVEPRIGEKGFRSFVNRMCELGIFKQTKTKTVYIINNAEIRRRLEKTS